MSTSLGEQFARALAVKDFGLIADLLHPEIDFRGMTPSRNWEAARPDAVIGEILRSWFDDEDEIQALEQLETGVVADRERVGYRFSVDNTKGSWIVEQQAYLSERDGRIGWMRVICSGFRPAA